MLCPLRLASSARRRRPKELPPPVTNLQQLARVQRIAELKMNGRASEGGVKRQREQEENDYDHEEEEEPDCLEDQATAHPMLPILPLKLLAVAKSYHGTLVWAQLCNPQGVALFSFVHVPPRLPRPFAGAAVYGMSLTHAERLCAVGCGLKGKLVRLLSLGVGRHFEPQRNRSACHRMMHSTVRRVKSKPIVVVRDKAAKEAEELCASGQYAATAVALT